MRIWVAMILVVMSLISACQPRGGNEHKLTVTHYPLLETYFLIEAMSAPNRRNNVQWETFKTENARKQQPLIQKALITFSNLSDDPIVLQTAALNDDLLESGQGNEVIVKAIIEATKRGELSTSLDDRDILSSDKAPTDSQVNISEYLQNLKEAYQTLGFSEFIEENSKFYNGAIGEVSKHVSNDAIEKMEHFYRAELTEYEAIVSPMMVWPIEENEGRGIGGKVTIAKSVTAFSVMSPYVPLNPKSDTDLGFGYDHQFRTIALTVHEFSHSFVNSVLDDFRDQISKSSHLYTPDMKALMNTKGIGDWHTYITETCVRVGEMRIAEAMKQPDTAEALRDYHMKEGFVFLKLAEQMAIQYEKSDPQEADYSEFVEAFTSSLNGMTDLDNPNK